MLQEQVGEGVWLQPFLGLVVGSGAPWVEGLVSLVWVEPVLSHWCLIELRFGETS